MSLAPKLAFRNLFHDRLRLIATVIGIVFSIVLVTVQMGLYVSFERMVTVMIDHADADLWIVPRGTKCFEDPSLLDERERFRALSVARRRVGGAAGDRLCAVAHAVGRHHADLHDRLRPARRRPAALERGRRQRAMRSPFPAPSPSTAPISIGWRRPGSATTPRSATRRCRWLAITNGIRSFTTTPYVFTSIDRARAYTGTAANKASYFLVRVTPGAERRRRCATACAPQLPDVEVLTTAEFRERSANFWLFGTGAGAALFAGALLGVIVGTVIVAQTLYSSTKDHLNEFATLRAIGSSGGYIHKVIILQALLSAVIGFCIAASDRLDRGAGDRRHRAAGRHHAADDGGPARAHRADVRRVGDRGHREGDADRSCDGVHAMTGAGDRSRRCRQVPGRRRRPRAGAQGRQPGGRAAAS